MSMILERNMDFDNSQEKLKHLFLVQKFYDIKGKLLDSDIESTSPEDFLILKEFLLSGKAYGEGKFKEFDFLKTAEVYSFINKSLSLQEILNNSFMENVDGLLNKINNIKSLNMDEKKKLLNFIDNLISNLNEHDSNIKTSNRNLFDW